MLQAIRVGHIGIFEHDHAEDDIHWSLELREMYGWDPEEPATLPKILSHVHPEDAGRVIAAVRRAHDPSGDGLFDIEHRILNRQGEVRWVQTRSQTHFADQQGVLKASRTIGAVQDITERRNAEIERKRLEADLMHAQRMESIGRLAGGVAHDFNNMLTVISGGISLSVSTLPPGHPCLAYLGDAAQATRSATALTRQLLAFARKEPVAPQTLDVNATIAQLKRMIARLVGESVQLSFDLSAGLPSIRFDPAQAEQVILNLAANARDAMPEGGRLSFRTSETVLADAEVEARRRFVLLAVRDEGTGMSEEVQQHLFEPFFTTKAPGEGTGLGLSTVYAAVRQNGGHVEVESSIGAGTLFKVYLPAVTAEAAI